SITGTTRSISICAAIGSAPGRVDSPPMSITTAPSSAIRRPVSTARCGSKFTPPSENESGVTLMMPMTAGGVRISSLRPRGRTKLIVALSRNPRSESVQSLLDALVAAIDLMDVVDDAFAFRAKRGEQQRHAGADVGAGDLPAREASAADDDRPVRIAQDDA